MPRPNPTRTVGREEALAGRIAELRQTADPPMSYDALAKRMAAVGCPIQPSAIQRIEKGNPRRKVTVDELVAFAQVFNRTLDELTALPQSGPAEQAQAQLDAYRKAVLDWQSARERLAVSVVEEQLAYEVLSDKRRSLASWKRRLGVSGPNSANDDQRQTLGTFLEAVKRDIDRQLDETPLPLIIVPPWVERVD